MPEAPHSADQPQPSSPGHELSDAKIRPLATFVTGLGMLLIVALLAMWGMFRYFAAREAKTEAPPSPLVDIQPGFKLTDQALDKLREENIPTDILAKLEGLKNQKYSTADEFVSALETTLGKDQTLQYKALFLKHADTRRLPPPPRLEVAPEKDWQQLRAAEDEKLNTYGWVNKDASVVRIPIERAMDLVAERGLPVRSEGATQGQGDAATRRAVDQTTPENSGSGRTLEGRQ